MTVLEIESLLADRGLRLRRTIRGRVDGRTLVGVEDLDTGQVFEASGIGFRDAVKNAIEAALRRPVKRTKRRYVS